MSVDELVEGVARAIAGHFGPAYDDLLPSRLEVRKSGQPNDNDQDGVREAARSAILAVMERIREPTPWMANVGGGVLYHGRHVPDGPSDAVAAQTYTAMIDTLRASLGGAR